MDWNESPASCLWLVDRPGLSTVIPIPEDVFAVPQEAAEHPRQPVAAARDNRLPQPPDEESQSWNPDRLAVLAERRNA